MKTTGEVSNSQRRKSGTFARHTNLDTKANLAKELACPHTGHTLPIVVTQTKRVEARTHNKSICKSGAGQCNISYVQASTAVRADSYKFGFQLLTSTLYFQMGHLYQADEQ